MTRINLVNVNFVSPTLFQPFTADKYRFYPKGQGEEERRTSTYTPDQAQRDNRKHTQNAYVEYSGAQENSILFRNGYIYFDSGLPRKRKLLEDILVIGSILTGRNWALFSQRDTSAFPATASNHLDYIAKDSHELEAYFTQILPVLRSSAWQTQYDNGFHLRMLLNRSNILVSEGRFLANMVIWEWLFPHLKNPRGATPNDESEALIEIFNFVLDYFWPTKKNQQIFTDNARTSENIFYFLRNQLAHSGKLPINRKHHKAWMASISQADMNDYLDFFDRLTHIVVLKTLGIDGEGKLSVFNFEDRLNSFLSTGKIR